MALDANFTTVVDNLEDIKWERVWDGGVYVRQIGPPIILDKASRWATVLLAQQDWRSIKKGWDPLRFVVSRWQWIQGAWRVGDYFRFNAASIAKLGELFADGTLMQTLKEGATTPNVHC